MKPTSDERVAALRTQELYRSKESEFIKSDSNFIDCLDKMRQQTVERSALKMADKQQQLLERQILDIIRNEGRFDSSEWAVCVPPVIAVEEFGDLVFKQERVVLRRIVIDPPLKAGGLQDNRANGELRG